MLRTPVTIACIAACTALSGIAAAQTIQIDKNNKTIAISTTDEATATADIAAVTVGFEIYGSDYESAYTNGGKISQLFSTRCTRPELKTGVSRAPARTWSGTPISTTRTRPRSARKGSSSSASRGR
jgi:hypothetical protein